MNRSPKKLPKIRKLNNSMVGLVLVFIYFLLIFPYIFFNVLFYVLVLFIYHFVTVLKFIPYSNYADWVVLFLWGIRLSSDKVINSSNLFKFVKPKCKRTYWFFILDFLYIKLQRYINKPQTSVSTSSMTCLF